MKNKVVIIGSDHINTLGVIRTFGENNIRSNIIIISDTKNIAVKKSRYVENCWICKKEEDVVDILYENFPNETEKTVLIPTSDTAALILDRNYDKLKKVFIVPNIDNKQCAIEKYMDKFNQYKLAKKNGVDMAKSLVIDLDNKADSSDTINYPCILKPIVSAEGDKNDIVICKDETEYLEKLNILKAKNYSTILVQEYINFDYEYELVGYVYKNKVCIPGITKKIRIWPEKRGSTTKGKILPVNKHLEEIEKIKKLISVWNYTGIIDIEIFIKDNKFYLNEINFRNSGHSYAYGNSYICYYWYLSCIKQQFEEAPKIETEYYFVDDQADLHNVFERKIKFGEYIRDKKNSKYLLVKNKIDKKPSKYMFIYKIKNKIKGKLKML